jgi:hypothetical protein
MASPPRRVPKALKLERSSEVSRLEGQVLAAVYELATPFLRHPIPNSTEDRQPRDRYTLQADRLPCQAGGSLA